jgi:hypothetical protein
MTVSGFTMTSAVRHPAQRREWRKRTRAGARRGFMATKKRALTWRWTRMRADSSSGHAAR